jgi:hypothetical protein
MLRFSAAAYVYSLTSDYTEAIGYSVDNFINTLITIFDNDWILISNLDFYPAGFVDSA